MRSRRAPNIRILFVDGSFGCSPHYLLPDGCVAIVGRILVKSRRYASWWDAIRSSSIVPTASTSIFTTSGIIVQVYDAGRSWRIVVGGI